MTRISLTEDISLPRRELEFTAMRSAGAGGQAVNKQSTAVRLRLDIPASSLPETVKQRLLTMADQRISEDGVLLIKAQEHRSQYQNRRAALNRLRELIRSAGEQSAPRIPTRPGRGARERRLNEKRRRGTVKSLRRPPSED